MVENGEFAEWAEVHGNLYGTSIRTLQESRADGIDLILDIDCQGAAKLKESNVQGVNIFILPPSFGELKRRLESRNSDSKEVIDQRVTNAASEILAAKWYDYIIVNDVFSKAVEELKSIIIAERLRTSVIINFIGKEFNII
jgi:guanylate kinase